MLDAAACEHELLRHYSPGAEREGLEATELGSNWKQLEATGSNWKQLYLTESLAGIY